MSACLLAELIRKGIKTLKQQKFKVVHSSKINKNTKQKKTTKKLNIKRNKRRRRIVNRSNGK